MSDDTLLRQVEAALRGSRARYILTATVQNLEYEVGDTIINPGADATETRARLLLSIHDRLRHFGMSEGQIAQAIITIEEAPLLY